MGTPLSILPRRSFGAILLRSSTLEGLLLGRLLLFLLSDLILLPPFRDLSPSMLLSHFVSQYLAPLYGILDLGLE
ncbi:MAG: hypothetical protein ACK56F_26140, partial [bacterium]